MIAAPKALASLWTVQAMGSPLTAEVLADVANFTTIAPVLQTSETY